MNLVAKIESLNKGTRVFYCPRTKTAHLRKKGKVVLLSRKGNGKADALQLLYKDTLDATNSSTLRSRL